MKRWWGERWWTENQHALRSLGSSLAREPWAWAANVSIVATAIVLPLTVHLALLAAAPTVQSLVTDPEISVFLALDSSPSAMAEVERVIREKTGQRATALPGARFTVQAVPKAQALATFVAQAQRAGQKDGLFEIKDNPLPDGFVVRASHVPAEVLGALATDFRSIARVEHVQVDTEWAGTLARVVRWMTLAQWLLMALFGIVIVAVTFGAARTQVLADRDEIAVARLIGATNAFVRRPFMLRGALLGLLGGALALFASGLGSWVLGGMLQDSSTILPGPAVCCVAAVLPAVLGGFGGWWCAHRSLGM